MYSLLSRDFLICAGAVADATFSVLPRLPSKLARGGHRDYGTVPPLYQSTSSSPLGFIPLCTGATALGIFPSQSPVCLGNYLIAAGAPIGYVSLLYVGSTLYQGLL